MSSPYKEWIEDRQKDALADISKIAIQIVVKCRKGRT